MLPSTGCQLATILITVHPACKVHRRKVFAGSKGNVLLVPTRPAGPVDRDVGYVKMASLE